MHPFLRAACSLILGICAAQACAVTLTPNAIGGGNIPGTYPSVDFYTGDGDWAPTLRLPASALPGATITLHTNASFGSNVALDNTELPLPSLSMTTGDTMTFTYDAGTGRWLIQMLEYSPKTVGATVPNFSRKLARYTIGDGDWVPTVTLPTSAAPGALLVVQSRVAWGTGVAPANVLHGSDQFMGPSDRDIYVFHPELRKWYLLDSTVAAVGPQQLDQGAMRRVTRPRVTLTLPEGTAALSIRLPSTAGDRIRVRVRSDATSVHTIRNDGIDFAGTLRVAKGDIYEFMWVAEKNRWVMMSSPTRTHDAQALAGGQMPGMVTPLTRIVSHDGNWLPTLALPTVSRPGDRVIVESHASWGFQVVAGQAPANFESIPFATGDTIAFIVDPQGRWTRETRTVDMLNVYSDKVVAAYGAQAARARQLESFRLTNEALENSGANFRLKMVGLMQHRDQGTSLNDAVTRLRDDAVVQNERRRLKADAIYYEGAEEGCGLAWMNSSPSSYNMVGTGSIQCGTTVMRHEFGHNMGLAHGGEAGSPVYATGYSLLGTIMGGNAIPYYATPTRYDAQLGVAMGVPGQIDAVRAMNEHSEAVAGFYR